MTGQQTGPALLGVTSNYSFLRGASHPAELVRAASVGGYDVIGVADRNSLAGVVRAWTAGREQGIRVLTGARLVWSADGPDLLCFPADREAWARLSALLTKGRKEVAKGCCRLEPADILAIAPGQVMIALLPLSLEALKTRREESREFLGDLKAAGPERLGVGVTPYLLGQDRVRLGEILQLATDCDLPPVAVGDILYHSPERRPLQDVVTCIRHGVSLDYAGNHLWPNSERHIRPAPEMAALLQRFLHDQAGSALDVAREFAAAVSFCLSDLRYEYPDEICPDGRSPQQELEFRTWEGAERRWPGILPEKVRQQIGRELDLIGSLDYAPYFLTVYDLVRFARERGILCQGRGSAANSAVCYCLGITAVDPERMDLLFERFISAERDEPPDIDVDFEHERREEVIRYIYEKYGRDRAGIAAAVHCYRSRGAFREVGKVMGLSADVIDRLARTGRGSRDGPLTRGNLEAAGLVPDDPRLLATLQLAAELRGFPRHLGQHSGGFVISRGSLAEMVPIGNAAMAGRSFIEWDKDDLDALGLLKIDVLALGMLTCLRKGLDLLARYYRLDLDLAEIPAEDSAVYDMLCKADTIGVFQIESRAQMSMLPRLKPREFYDLVVEVAIVRPGPIQGDMVHPYLRRRSGQEAVSFPSRELEAVLGKTLGVPLFQEQAMRLAIVAGGFTPAEADALRRAMATFKKPGEVSLFREKLISGMVERGYEQDFAERCFRQIEGFGTYGFPESHAASFALLVYVSAWMKCHYPAVFACALLNSQPMGFYAPAQIIADARAHGVDVRAPDVNRSDQDYSLEPGREGDLALRIGLRQIRGLAEEDGLMLVAERGNGYPDLESLQKRAGLGRRALECLAAGDAFRSLGIERREALWRIARLPWHGSLPLFAASEEPDQPPEDPADLAALPEAGLGEAVVEDFGALRMSLRRHPLLLLRGDLEALRTRPNADLARARDGQWMSVAGLVLVRQQPGSAKGVIFVTLEDETGVANLVIWPDSFRRYRPAILGSRLMWVRGRVQREESVVHLVAGKILDMSDMLDSLWQRDGAGRLDTGLRAADGRALSSAAPREEGGENHAVLESGDARNSLPFAASYGRQAFPLRRGHPRGPVRRPRLKSRDFH